MRTRPVSDGCAGVKLNRNKLTVHARIRAGVGSLHRFHWLVVALSLLVTGSAWWISRALIEERATARFDREVTQLVSRVTERMERYENALRAGVSAIAARGGDIDRDVWRTFANSLQIEKRYPGINGIGVIRYATRNTLDELIVRERLANPAFTIFPERDAEEYLPITYIEPEAVNREAVGLDIAHEAHRLAGALRARDTGLIQMTAPIVLVQDAEKTPGFLLFKSVPRNEASGVDAAANSMAVDRDDGARARRMDGLVYAPFIVNLLMEDVLGDEERHVTVGISDDGETILDEHDARVPGHDPDPLKSTTVDVPLYGRVWRFDIRSDLSFRQSIVMQQPTLVLMGGIAIDLMLVALFVGMSRTNRALSKVAELNQVLARKADALADSNRDLERFACVVSHDLKTPVRGMGDLAWYLEEDLEDYLSSEGAKPEIKYNIDRMHGQVKRMNALIDGILDYSAIRDQTMTLEYFDTRAIFDEVAESLGLERSQLTVVGSLPGLHSCPTRFLQVMSNIIGNAIKYHPDREQLLITVTATSRGEFLRLSIADNGPGIDPRFHGKIFEIFQTLQTRDDIESTGVGLSIVRKSVESVGGKVSVESVPGSGATFHVDWPYVTRPVDHHLPEATTVRPTERLRNAA